MRLRNVVLSDLELGRASFPLSAAMLAFLGQRGAINLVLATLVVYALRPLALPRALDASVLLAAAVLAWGNALSLYSHILYYDLVAHFFVQLLIAPCLYFLLLRATGATVSGSSAPVLVMIFALGLTLGALWEIAEWTSDGAFGTSFVKGEADTMTDLIADACGAFVGAARYGALARFREVVAVDLELETES